MLDINIVLDDYKDIIRKKADVIGNLFKEHNEWDSKKLVQEEIYFLLKEAIEEAYQSGYEDGEISKR